MRFLVLALADASKSATRLFDPRHNIFWGVGAMAVIVLVGTLTVPFMSGIFRVEAPDGVVIALSVVVAVIAGGWYGVARRRNLLAPPQPARSVGPLTSGAHIASPLEPDR